MQAYFQIGIIAGTHGVKGALRILHTANDPSRFKKLSYVFLSDENVSSSEFDEKALKRYDLCCVKMSGRYVIAELGSVTTREEAGNLKGKSVIIERKDTVKLAEDEYFIADLIGCVVYDKKRGVIGTVNDVMQTGSNDVYVVGTKKYGEVLIPAIRDVLLDVDIIGRIVTVDLMEGLVDD